MGYNERSLPNKKNYYIFGMRDYKINSAYGNVPCGEKDGPHALMYIFEKSALLDEFTVTCGCGSE